MLSVAKRVGSVKCLGTAVGLGQHDGQREIRFPFGLQRRLGGAQIVDVRSQFHGEEVFIASGIAHGQGVDQHQDGARLVDHRADGQVGTGVIQFGRDRFAGEIGGDDVQIVVAVGLRIDFAVHPLPAVGFGRRFLGKAPAFEGVDRMLLDRDAEAVVGQALDAAAAFAENVQQRPDEHRLAGAGGAQDRDEVERQPAFFRRARQVQGCLTLVAEPVVVKRFLVATNARHLDLVVQVAARLDDLFGCVVHDSA